MDTDAEDLRAFVVARDRAALGRLIERHRGTVYDLARRVLRDGHLAEDATQEAFVQVIRRAGTWRGEGPVRAWIYRLGLNAARMLLRARGRRDAHELVVVPGAPSEPPEAAATRAEVRAAVEALPEEMQLPVVLHYFRGLSHAEVAVALECPTGTVASRIHDAKERLRARLGALTAGGTAWLATLEAAEAAPDVSPSLATRLADLVSGAAPGPAAGPRMQGRFRSGRVVAAVGVLGLAVVGGGIWAIGADPLAASSVPAAVASRPPGEPTAPTAPGRLPADAGGGGDARAPTPAATERLRAEDETGEPGLGALVLRVVDGQGRPIPGAAVRLGEDPGDPEVEGAEELAHIRAVAGADGRARLTVPFPGVRDACTTAAFVRAPGLASRRLADVQVFAGVERDLGDVALDAGATLRGRVHGPDGAPVAGASLWAGRVRDQPRVIDGWRPDRAIAAGVDGTFALPAVAPHEAVRVEASGFAPSYWGGPDDAELDIELTPAFTIHGRAVGDARPSRFRVRLCGGLTNTGDWVVPDADGRFTIPGVPADHDVVLLASDPDWNEWDRVALEAGTYDGGMIELRCAAAPRDGWREGAPEVLGRVVDAASGVPVTRFTLSKDFRTEMAPGREWEWKESTQGFSDPEGRFRVRAQAAGQLTLWIRARGYREVRVPVDVVAGQRIEGLEVALERGGASVSGRVRSRDGGAPVPGVRVEPFRRYPKWQGGADVEDPLHSAVLTDRSGAFRIACAGDGPLLLRLDGAQVGFGRTEIDVTTRDGREIEVALDACGTLAGIVRGPDGAPRPKAGLAVLASRDPDASATRIQSDERGRFSLDGLAPGDYLIGPAPDAPRDVEWRGLRWQSQGPSRKPRRGIVSPVRVSVRHGSPAAVAVTVPEPCTIEVRTTWGEAGDAAAPWDFVRLEREDGWGCGRSIAPQASTLAIAPGLSPGRYSARVSRQGWFDLRSAPAEIGPGELGRFDLVTPDGALALRLSGPDGTPVPIGWYVTLQPAGGGEDACAPTPTTEGGLVRLRGPVAGNYVAEVREIGGRHTRLTTSAAFRVRGVTEELSLALAPAPR